MKFGSVDSLAHRGGIPSYAESNCARGGHCKLKSLGGYATADECQLDYEPARQFAIANNVIGGQSTLRMACPVPVNEGKEF